MKITSGLDRLVFFVLIFMLLTHIATCLWIVVASMNQSAEVQPDGNIFVGTWLEPYYIEYEESES